MPSTAQDRLANFLEELGWLLSSYSDLPFEDIAKLFKVRRQSAAITGLEALAPSNPNILFLVGALPGLFMDRRLFPRNDDIARFSTEVLHVPVSRTEKRSQYELIGLILCEVTKLDDRKLERVTLELRDIVVNKDQLGPNKFMGGWNAAIRRLTGVDQQSDGE